jgi:chromosomal replication initiator protein
VPYNNYVDANLNNIYLFDTFVVGESNKFAHAASLAVAENPGKVYNPLFIYGKSGLGKTHLMHAIGNYIIKIQIKKFYILTSEQFINDFLDKLKKDETGTNFNSINTFNSKYRNLDVLIIDDIQFLGGTIKANRNFFIHLIICTKIINR